MARSPNDHAAALAQDHYAANHRGFHWAVPSRMNMAHWCCARWAQRGDAAQRIAVIADGEQHSPRAHSYAELQDQANRLSRVLALRGVRRGDRVAIVLPQRFETAVAYMAVLQMGAVAMPLSQLFGPEALAFRLQDSAAVAAVVDASTAAGVLGVRGECPSLRCVVGVDVGPGVAGLDLDWATALARVQPKAVMVDTAASDPAVLIYTSGTTGNPKGGLIPHSALFGNLTGFLCSQNWLGHDPCGPGADAQGFPPEASLPVVFWSPADWAWTGGLMDALLPMLFFGRPIVAYNGRFAPETAFELLQRHRVTHSFLFPTALKAMMKAVPDPRARYDFKLHACMSAGEAVGDAVFNWCREALGVVVNEMFGQTEINYIVGNCAMNDERSGGVGWPAKPGSMGKGYPGHRVAVIDDEARECPPGQPGEVAVHRFDVHGVPDPVFFLGYWGNEEATRKKYSGDWCRTGDMAVADEDGYLWYQGRADDMFKAAGYRIGPSEIENCLVKHPAVANAAVVPKPDEQRGAVVKAYVVLTPEFAQVRGDATREAEVITQLQAHVRGRLAPYEYPKDIEFIDALPMTTTGKVQRRVLRLREEARARGEA
jgi:acetyl-CoA synthetase